MPGVMLETACGRACAIPDPSGRIVDESIDPLPVSGLPQKELVHSYIASMVFPARRTVPLFACAQFTRARAASALLDAVWREGHYRFGDLSLSARWSWNDSVVGNMAAFYASVEALCDEMDGLGISLKDYCVEDAPAPGISMDALLSSSVRGKEDIPDDDPFFGELPFQTEHPVMGHARKCPGKARCDEGNWLIYVPFDTCQPMLGGSYLAEVAGLSCGRAVELESPDYFIDCFEVVRELVEDGIALSGETVSDGGLMYALRRLVPEDRGFDAEVGGIMKSYSGAGLVRILFSEIPGVILEISGDDYDYVDAELLLQDVAYYPIGRFTGKGHALRVLESDNSDISEILHSLLNVQVSEGED